MATESEAAANNGYLDYIDLLTNQCLLMRRTIENSQQDNRCLSLSNQAFQNAFHLIQTHVERVDKELGRRTREMLSAHMVFPTNYHQVDKERVEEIAHMRMQIKTAHGNQIRHLREVEAAVDRLRDHLLNLERDLKTMKGVPGYRERRNQVHVCTKVADLITHQLNAGLIFADFQAIKHQKDTLVAENDSLKLELSVERDTMPGKLNLSRQNGIFEGRRQILEEKDLHERINSSFLKGMVAGRRAAFFEARASAAATREPTAIFEELQLTKRERDELRAENNSLRLENNFAKASVAAKSLVAALGKDDI